MNIINKIKEYCSHGEFVVVTNKLNYFDIWSFLKDPNGNYRRSGWWNTIKEAKEFIGTCSGHFDDDAKNRAEQNHWEIVEVYYPTFEPFKIGQRVKILDTIKETEDWCKEYEENYPKMEGIIVGVEKSKDGLMYPVKGKREDDWSIAHQYLIPLFEDNTFEGKTATVEIDGKKFEVKVIKELNNL